MALEVRDRRSVSHVLYTTQYVFHFLQAQVAIISDITLKSVVL